MPKRRLPGALVLLLLLACGELLQEMLPMMGRQESLIDGAGPRGSNHASKAGEKSWG